MLTSCAGAGWEAVVAQAGGVSGCTSVCQQFLAFWAVPRISENKNESMTVPLTPSGGERSVSLVSDIPSSKQCSDSDQQNVHTGHFFVAFLTKNSRLFSK